MVKYHFYTFFLMLWCIVFLLGCESPTVEETDFLTEEELDAEVETTYDVELIYSDSAIVSVIVRSPKMLTSSTRGDNKQIFPEGVAVDFFDPKGKVQSELTCKKATRFERDKSILMQDSVVWRSRSGEILDSDELVWDEGDQKLRSDRFVKITTLQDVIHGYGFEADQGFTKWKIMRPQGEMGVKDLE